jgi:nucleoside-diphosphate-sugar epimerase
MTPEFPDNVCCTSKLNTQLINNNHTGATNVAKVFLAGAAGAIGKRLLPQLLDAGYEVFGMTRSAEKVDELKTAGVTPIVVDVFDAPALSRAMTAVRPEIVINQLTDLPAKLEPSGA